MLRILKKQTEAKAQNPRLEQIDFVDTFSEIKTVIGKLQDVDRSCQQQKATVLLFRWFPWLLASVILLFLLDVFFHLESNTRVAMIGCGILCCLGLLAAGFYICFLRRNSLESIARFVENQDRSLGSQFINMLQLKQQTEDPSLQPTTRKMAQLAQRNYALILCEKHIQPLAKIPGLKKYVKIALYSLLLFLAILGLFYQVALIEVIRYLDPYGDHPPYSITQLEIADPGPQPKQVVYGKSCLVKAKYSGHKPSALFLSYYPEKFPNDVHTIPLFEENEGGYFQQIENIQSNLVVFVHTKNRSSISKKHHISVILTPQMEKGFVQITPPRYTGLQIEEKPYSFANLKLLKGTALQFRFQSNRPLKNGLIDLIPADGPPLQALMKSSDTNEISGGFVVNNSSRIRFTLIDHQEIASADNLESSITLLSDLPPAIAFRSPERDCFVAEDYSLNIQLEASDDYGLQSIRFHLAKNDKYSEPITTNYPSRVRQALEVYPIDFKQLGVKPGDSITCFAEAVDSAPEPSLSKTEPLHIKIISVEEFNQFVRQNSDFNDLLGKYGQLMDQLAEQIQKQTKLRDEAERLQKQSTDQNAQSDWEKLITQQDELNQNLKNFSDTIQQLIRDQPVYDIEKEWNKTLKEMSQSIKKSADTNTAEVASLPQNPGKDIKQSLNAFQKSAQEQLARLGMSEDNMKNNVMEPAEQLSLLHELMKDFNAFENMLKIQGTLSEQSKAYNRPGTLSREDQLSLRNMAGIEHQMEEELQSLAQKLRKDAAEAESQFPKAASSAREMADKMDQLRLSYLANQATESMLAAQGQQSNQRAQRLLAEMESLCSDCQSGEGESGNEADGYLKAQKNQKPGKTAEQMKLSQKFGTKFGKGTDQGSGQGQKGSSLADANRLDVFGNESMLQTPLTYERGNRKAVPGFPLAEMENNPEARKDKRRGLDSVRHSADSVSVESVADEYQSIVDQYFRAIAK